MTPPKNKKRFRTFYAGTPRPGQFFYFDFVDDFFEWYRTPHRIGRIMIFQVLGQNGFYHTTDPYLFPLRQQTLFS